jgi:hypothetical protein
MTEPSAANLELAIALPLGAVANQLTKIEADLRFLSIKASAYAGERGNGELAAKAAGGLEKIIEALDLIRGVVADFQAGIQAAGTAGKSARERASRKSSADQDD